MLHCIYASQLGVEPWFTMIYVYIGFVPKKSQSFFWAIRNFGVGKVLNFFRLCTNRSHFRWNHNQNIAGFCGQQLNAFFSPIEHHEPCKEKFVNQASNSTLRCNNQNLLTPWPPNNSNPRTMKEAGHIPATNFHVHHEILKASVYKIMHPS